MPEALSRGYVQMKINYDAVNNQKDWIAYYERMLKHDAKNLAIHKKRLARVEKGEKLDSTEF